MTTVKCANCGAERELTYAQIEVVNREQRHCPSCGVGKERVVVREEKFQPLVEFLKAPVVEGDRQAAVDLSEVFGVPAEPVPSPSQSQEPAAQSSDAPAPEQPGITVGPGGTVTRRRRPSTD